MTRSKTPSFLRTVVMLGVLGTCAGASVRAATYTWDPNGDLSDAGGVWTISASNWYSGTSDTSWTNGSNTAAFGWGSGGTTPCTVTLGSNITAGGVAFNNQSYTIAPDAGNLDSLTLGTGGIAAMVSATLNAPLTLSASQTWSVASGQTLTVGASVAAGGNLLALGGAGNATISAPLTTATDLDIVGSGTLDLSAAGNTIGGYLYAAGGTLELIGNSTTTAGRVYVADSGIAGGGNGTLNIKDNALLSTSGGFYLGNQNNYAGTVNQSGGTVNLTFSGSGFRVGHWPNETSSYNLSAGLLDVPNTTVYVGWNGNGQLNISGGTATLYGLNLSYDGNESGTLNFTSGLLQLGAGGLTFTSGHDAENLGGGTLAAIAGFSTAASLNFTGAGGNTTIDTGANAVTLFGNLSGTGGFKKIGSGTLTLAQTSSYSGGTIVSAGTLVVNPTLLNNGAGLLGSGTLTINTGATVDTYVNSFGYNAGGLIPVIINGGVLNQIPSGDYPDSHIGAVTMTGGTMSGTEFQPHSGITTNAANTTAVISAGTLTLQATVHFTVAAGAAAPDLSVSSLISGGYGITKNGPGVMRLSGASTYSGGTTLNAGTLIVANGANGSALGSGTLTLNGGTLAAGAAGGTLAGLVQAGSGQHTIAPGLGLSAGYGTLNLNGGLSGNAHTTLAFNLGAPESGGTYSGDLIHLGGAGLSGSGSITFVTNPTAAGDYRLFGGTLGSPTLGNFLLPTAPGGDAYWLSTTADAPFLDLVVSTTASTISTTYNLAAAVSASLLHSGGTATATATITNVGCGQADMLNYAGLGLNASGGALSGPGLPLSGLSLGQGSTASGSQTYTASIPGTITLTPVVSGGTNATLCTSANLGAASTATISVFSGSGTWTSSSGSLWSDKGNWIDANGVQAAPGTFAGFTSTDAATFSGSGSVTSISLSGANPSLRALSLSGSNYTLSDGTLTMSSTGMAAITASGTQSIGSLLCLAGSADMVVSGDMDWLAISGQVVGNGPLFKDGAGTLVLSGSDNTYSGGTVVDAGTLILTDGGAIAGGTSLTVGAGGTVVFDPGQAAAPLAGPQAAAAAVPEPGTLVLLAAALGCAAIHGRFRRRPKTAAR